MQYIPIQILTDACNTYQYKQYKQIQPNTYQYIIHANTCNTYQYILYIPMHAFVLHSQYKPNTYSIHTKYVLCMPRWLQYMQQDQQGKICSWLHASSYWSFSLHSRHQTHQTPLGVLWPSRSFVWSQGYVWRTLAYVGGASSVGTGSSPAAACSGG